MRPVSTLTMCALQAMEFVRKIKTTGLPSGNTIALAAAIRAFGPYASPAAERRELDPLASIDPIASTRALRCARACRGREC